jgi:formiminoglutamase
VAEWSGLLEPARLPAGWPRRADDPRLGEVIEFWDGTLEALRPGRAVIVGFPQDEGVRRNRGRVGAADAPREIRSQLWRLVPWDATSEADLAALPPVDIGDVRVKGTLEEAQEALGNVVAELLMRKAVPVVLGGGHETAYGHYLGYVRANKPVGVINLDAHLDVRPLIDGKGHSGSPFRQMLEHPTQPLPGKHYVCLGIQSQTVSSAHLRYARERGCIVHTAGALQTTAAKERLLTRQIERLRKQGCSVYLSIDADVVHERDVPGVSAPNAMGLPGGEIAGAARLAGTVPRVSSVDLVEVNPRHDRDNQSARWAALVIWSFLVGLAFRNQIRPAAKK